MCQGTFLPDARGHRTLACRSTAPTVTDSRPVLISSAGLLYSLLRVYHGGMNLFQRCFIAIAVASLMIPTHAFAGTDERIKEFIVSARITSDRHTVITERIAYDFGGRVRHGIYRDLPVEYMQRGLIYRLPVHVVDVLKNGAPVAWKETVSGGMMHLQIGEAHETVTGIVSYTIQYETDRAIQTFATGPEFYWNVTGNEWGVPIDFASIVVEGPAQAVHAVCYTGALGSAEGLCRTISNSTKVSVENTVPFRSGEGLTVAVRWSKEAFDPIQWWRALLWFFQDHMIALLPIGSFFFMLIVWLRYGKEPRGRGTIIAQYEPPAGMTPIELSALYTQMITSTSVLALLVDLARRGYMKIKWDIAKGEKSAKAFRFIKTSTDTGTLLPFEQSVIKLLFQASDEVTLDSIPQTPASALALRDIHEGVFTKLRSDGVFEVSPEKIRGGWYAVAALVTILALQIPSGTGGDFLRVCFAVLSGGIVATFGYFMPRMTKAGAERREEIEGFKLFLSVTEKDRLAFANAPAVRPELFERFLPYAIALGVDQLWAQRFASMLVPAPSYISVEGGLWSPNMPTLLARSFSSTASSVSTLISTRAQKGGSGFSGGHSGGGFGGGGGGSW